ncbi:MAG: MmgE/PrpD family protein [Chloroflexi bacterium]|nr:MmgE/PrpD family protein [Chloroflexota bacterium]
MNESRRFAEYLVGLKYTDLPEAVLEKTRHTILDQLGVELAASTKPWSQAIYKYARSFQGQRESTIVNYGDLVGSETAAFANATFGHGFETDDTDLSSNTHPGSVIIPAALAVCERDLLSGKNFMLAVACGYEAVGRIGRVVCPSANHRGFHPTSLNGPFGAAAVVGKALGFDNEMMLNALAIAGSHASGFMEYTQTGGEFKRMHAGMAAVGGMRAAFLAQLGLTGPPTILEGKKGFFRTFSNEYDTAKLTAGLGRDFIVSDISFKCHSCGYQIHAGIDATMELVRAHGIRPDEIAEIIVGTNSLGPTIVGRIVEPKDISSSQFSTAFCLGMAIVKGSTQFPDFNEANLRDERILKLARKVRLEVDPEIEAEFPRKRGVRMTLKLNDGRAYQKRLDKVKGTPDNPLTSAEVEDKFRRLASLVLRGSQVEEIIGTVRNLDSLGNVQALSRLLVR